MTPHEDSELAGPPYIEPLLVGRDKVRIANSSQSEAANSSRASSPSIVGQTVVHNKLLPSTIIEVPHNVLAQVQVHIVDTH